MEWLNKGVIPIECQGCIDGCDESEIADVDRKLYRFVELGENPNITLTQEMWERSLYICILSGCPQQYNKLWNDYPQFAETMIREFEKAAAESKEDGMKAKTIASLERFKERMRAELGEELI